MMESQEFVVLYTHQKTKKSKVWQDGILKLTHLGNKAILYDDKGGCLESVFLKHLEVKPGDDLESDRYLITVEEVKVAGSAALTQDVIKEAPPFNSRRTLPSGRSLGCQPAGLKRRFPGFHVPRQVPKKIVTAESGPPTASLETRKPEPAFLPPFYDTLPLFSTACKKEAGTIPTAPENLTAYSGEKDGMPSSSVCAPPFKINSEALCGDNYFYPTISSVRRHSDSFLTNEPVKTDGLASHCLGISQNIRTKAQIVALLKPKSSTGEELTSEITEHCLNMQPQEQFETPTKAKCLVEQGRYAEGLSTDTFHHQHQPGNPVSKKSRWAMYLSSQSSHSSDTDESDVERKPKAQGEDLNTGTGDLVQKKARPSEMRAGVGEAYNEDKQVLDHDPPSWDQEINCDIPSAWESVSSPDAYNSAANDGLFSGPGVQGNSKGPWDHNDQICRKEPILIRENALETPEREEEHEQPVSSPPPERGHLHTESSLSSTSDDRADMFSKRSTNNEGISGVNELMSKLTQPFWEINFNLDNFESSDSEEESQESRTFIQASECSVEEILVDHGSSCFQKSCRENRCKETDSECLPPSTATGDKAVEGSPSSQLSAGTCVRFDTAACKAGNTGKEVQEDCSDTLSNLDSALEWIDDKHVDNNQDANKPFENVEIDGGFVSLQNNSEDLQTNSHVHRLLRRVTDQTPESNSVFPEDPQPESLVLESDLDRNDEQVFPSSSSSDNSIQILNTNQDHSEYITLEKSKTQFSNSSLYHLEKKHISDEPKVHSSESTDLGQIGALPHGHIERESSKDCRQHWNNPRNSPGLSALEHDISLLRSLSEHRTALESLEMLKKENAPSEQQERQQTSSPESSPEAWKPLTIVSQTMPESPHLSQEFPRQIHEVLKEGKIEPNEPFESFQFATLGSEEKNAFLSVIPKQIETCDPKFADKENVPKEDMSFNMEEHFQMIAESDKDSIENDSISGFPSINSEHSYYLDYNFNSAERTVWEANQETWREQNASTLSPVSSFSLTPRDEHFVREFSEESLKARSLPGMKNVNSLKKKNHHSLPIVIGTQVPLVTLPPTDGPPTMDSYSNVTSCDKPASSDSPLCNLPDEAAFLSSNFESQDRSEAFFSENSGEEIPGSLSLLSNISSQSKWLKYQNTPQCNSTTPHEVGKNLKDVFAKTVPETHFSDPGERQRDAGHTHSLASVRLQRIKGMLYQQQQDASTHHLVSRKGAFSLNLEQTPKTEEIQNVLGESAHYYRKGTGDVQGINTSELLFPSGQEIKSAYLPQRQIHIPAVFQSPAHYKQIFTSCLIEHLNILLFALSQRLHKALSKVDISFYTSSKGERQRHVESNVPFCHHHQPAKLIMVKKEGPNKGRLFYTCDGSKTERCKFFKWFEEVSTGLTPAESGPGRVLTDIKGIGLYLRSQNIPLYEECQLLVRKGYDFQGKRYSKLKKFTTIHPELDNEPRSKLYLKLSRRESASAYSKNDLWVVSKTLDFELDTFIACSAFFGPSSLNEIELLPLKGYFPSNWPTNMVVHALLVCNASTELTTLRNIQSYFHPATLPLTQHLLAMSSTPPTTVSNKRVNKKFFNPPAFTNTNRKLEVSPGTALQLASELIQAHQLNRDQAAALIQVAQMMAPPQSAGAEDRLPIRIIHGVFGAGKSYLLAVVILFFVQLFEKSDVPTVGNVKPWKLLISSSTNVAVDRVLLGLLSLGFEKFVRVGSVRKIAKPILPYSLHSGSENESEQLKELHALMKEDLTPVEKIYVRKSIEQHKLGTNRTLLKQVRVIGVTCAACPFPCLNDLQFPVVVLDECSQITEPASLLPIARFECEKLILVGDPRQLPPTIQGSDAAHESGLEQTLFDRLCLMGHKPIQLRTQYRCHPAISAIANDLFYEGNLLNGVSETERSPLLDWLPTLCFYNVKGLEQMERDNSFQNVAEAAFTLKLIQSLIASGIEGSMIGVITLYKSQMYKVCHLLSAGDFDHSSLKAVQVSTVDAFQGAEKEIIILSCVRTRQVGFIDSEKRMNVALTRGRRHLLIVGNLACLRKNQLWERVIQHCEGREDGLQHASHYEPQLNNLLKDYLEKQKKNSEKEKSQ
ncbi:5'-3' DNA helicase ZGRF1 [Tenrec ecaudatus]|uniref:5'-3' DNA helicase ZGRF1 n=1 Tax=Tenrec ecaudatus TaxID=94439 RepID=UPI003F5AA002